MKSKGTLIGMNDTQKCMTCMTIFYESQVRHGSATGLSIFPRLQKKIIHFMSIKNLM